MVVDQSFSAANDLLGDGDALRGLLEERSHLYFRRLVPPEPILRARRDILKLCSEAGWLDPEAPLMEGCWSGGGAYVEGEPEYMAVYRKVLQLESFLELPHHPILMRLAEAVLGGEVLLHPRKIGRITFPARQEESTPPHQDHPLIKGTARTYTLWMPLGDCPRSLGGLAILPGSHRLGARQHVQMRGTGGTGLVLDEGAEWHSGDMELGDCLLFHSHTVHKALPNISGKYLRISTDNRYQLASDEVDPSSLRPHFDGWWDREGVDE
jgi:hypothetical protein